MRTALLTALASAVVFLPAAAAESPPPAAYRTVEWIQRAYETQPWPDKGFEARLRCSGVDDGRAPRYRYFACILYFRNSETSQWGSFGGSAFYSPSAGSAEIRAGAHGSPRAEAYGKNPRVVGGLQTRGAAVIEVIVVTRPTRRVRVSWALTCGKALDRVDTFSRTGSFVVSRRGQIRIRLPNRPPVCFELVDGRAESKTNARLFLRIWPR